MYLIIWLAAMVVFLIVESQSVTMVSLWFAAGALAALIAELCGAELWLQIVLFFAVGHSQYGLFFFLGALDNGIFLLTAGGGKEKRGKHK